MTSRLHPSKIDTIGSELAITWSDGTEGFFPFETLRKACPCALCQGEADVTGRTMPPVTNRPLSPAAVQLHSYKPIGAYAIQLTWGDGHASGIYSYELLRSLSSASQS